MTQPSGLMPFRCLNCPKSERLEVDCSKSRLVRFSFHCKVNVRKPSVQNWENAKIQTFCLKSEYFCLDLDTKELGCLK